jgi:hypothetical protein
MTDTVQNAPTLQNTFRDGQAAGSIDPQDVRNLIVSVLSALTGISAAGTTQSGATALTNLINIVSTVASGSGVVLTTGLKAIIMNRGANALAVYPPSTGQLEALGTNVPYMLQPGQDATFLLDPANPNQGYITVSLNIKSLATSLPSTAGVLWNNGGVLSIS